MNRRKLLRFFATGGAAGILPLGAQRALAQSSAIRIGFPVPLTGPFSWYGTAWTVFLKGFRLVNPARTKAAKQDAAWPSSILQKSCGAHRPLFTRTAAK